MPKFESQAKEIDLLLKQSGMTPEDMAIESALRTATFRRLWKGHQKASDLAMQSIRITARRGARLAPKEKETSPIHGLVGPRYVQVVSFARAGAAMAYEDIADDWQNKVATDSTDPKAFGVELRGDSMEPKYKDGQIAILRPSSKAQNGSLVIANLKNQGAVFKLLHVMNRGKFRLTSYNAVYPPVEANEKDFHWIYPVEAVVERILA